MIVQKQQYLASRGKTTQQQTENCWDVGHLRQSGASEPTLNKRVFLPPVGHHPHFSREFDRDVKWQII